MDELNSLIEICTVFVVFCIFSSVFLGICCSFAFKSKTVHNFSILFNILSSFKSNLAVFWLCRVKGNEYENRLHCINFH